MKENLDFLFSTSDSIPLNEFVVARLAPFTDISKPIPGEQIKQIFIGNNDNTSLLMGFGIARQVASGCGTVMLIFNPRQEVTFPNNVDYGQGKYQG